MRMTTRQDGSLELKNWFGEKRGWGRGGRARGQRSNVSVLRCPWIRGENSTEEVMRFSDEKSAGQYATFYPEKCLLLEVCSQIRQPAS